MTEDALVTFLRTHLHIEVWTEHDWGDNYLTVKLKVDDKVISQDRVSINFVEKSDIYY